MPVDAATGADGGQAGPQRKEEAQSVGKEIGEQAERSSQPEPECAKQISGQLEGLPQEKQVHHLHALRVGLASQAS